MFGGQIVRDRLAMDEPTIDCQCGAPGRVEYQLQELDDTAEWHTYRRGVRCVEHLDYDVPRMITDLSLNERMVLHPLL